MSPMFNNVKTWFENHFWTAQMVQDAVIQEALTQEECDQILNKEKNPSD